MPFSSSLLVVECLLVAAF